MHHIHHGQTRSACGPAPAGCQEGGKEGGASRRKWTEEEKRSSSHRLKVDKSAITTNLHEGDLMFYHLNEGRRVILLFFEYSDRNLVFYGELL